MVKRNAFLGMAAMALFFTLLIPGQAIAYCTATAESGVWVNPDAALKALARIEIRTTCIGGLRGWKVRALTRCVRTECTWGYALGVRRADGALAALFSTFSAERLIRMSVDRDLMNVAVISIFRGGRREDLINRYVLWRHYD